MPAAERIKEDMLSVCMAIVQLAKKVETTAELIDSLGITDDEDNSIEDIAMNS